MSESHMTNLKRLAFVVVALCVVLSVSVPLSLAQESAIQKERVKILPFYTEVRKAAIDDPKVAIVTARSPREIAVIGKEPGSTRLTLVFADGDRRIYDVEVTPEDIQVIEARGYDISRLKQRLNSLLPEEREIRIIASEDSITLAGRVSSAANLSQVLALAESHAPKGKVHNLLEVAGVHQVMLEVRVSEMSKSLTKRLGANLMYARAGDFGIMLPGKLADLAQSGGGGGGNANLSTGPLAFAVSPTVNTLFRFHDGSAEWTGLIDALREDGLVKVLAEPTLIALSGQTARFLVGGEIPIPIPQGLGTVGIEYKPFGVELAFTPTVLSEKKISINVTPSVSEPDTTYAINVSGYVVPGFTTRRASTVVELADGQSFAIAGLLNDRVRDTVNKYPFLGDVPVLGNLFKSREFRKNETELIIVVTPHLVKPLDARSQSLPTDFFVEPNDIDFYVWGSLQGYGRSPAPVRTASSQVKTEMEGDFGHEIPLTEE